MVNATGGASAPQHVDLDLRSLGAALARRKWSIIVPTVLVAIAAMVTVNYLTPRYKSEARIVYDGRENVFLRPEAEKAVNAERGPADAETLTNQIQIVQSRQIAQDVIRELKLNELPEFDPVLNGTSTLRQILTRVGISRNLLLLSPEERVLESWNDRLVSYSVDKSRVMVVEFQSIDPALAARVANQIVEDYLRQQQSNRQDQTRGAGQWLAGEIDKLRPRVAEAEGKAEEFRSRANLFVGTNNTSLSNQQLGELNSQLVAARGQKADSETRARIIRETLRKGEPIEALDIISSELIRRLSEQRVTLRAQLAEQSSTLLDGHPRIKELKAQIGDLDRQIRGEAEKAIRSLENDARIAGAKVDALTTSLDGLKRQATANNEQDVQLRALEREAKSQRDLLESYLARFRETTARDTIGTAPPDARVISSAVPSNTPAFPKKLPIVAVATLIAFVLSSGLVTASELLRATAPASARVPVTPSPSVQPEAAPIEERKIEERKPVVAQAVAATPSPSTAPVMDAPATDFAHVVKEVRESARSGAIAVVAAIADLSTGPHALAVARALAADSKVVVVGLVRREGRTDFPADANAPGLSDVIAGAATFGAIISKDRLSGAHVIPPGRSGISLQECLASPQFRVMMEALCRAYRFVIIDSGTVGRDSGLVAAIAPRCVLVVPTDSAPRAAAAAQLMGTAGFAEIMLLDAAEAHRVDGLAAA